MARERKFHRPGKERDQYSCPFYLLVHFTERERIGASSPGAFLEDEVWGEEEIQKEKSTWSVMKRPKEYHIAEKRTNAELYEQYARTTLKKKRVKSSRVEKPRATRNSWKDIQGMLSIESREKDKGGGESRRVRRPRPSRGTQVWSSVGSGGIAKKNYVAQARLEETRTGGHTSACETAAGKTETQFFSGMRGEWEGRSQPYNPWRGMRSQSFVKTDNKKLSDYHVYARAAGLWSQRKSRPVIQRVARKSIKKGEITLK